MSPTRWVLNMLGETPFNLQQMPDFLVTILRYQLPGLAGFCLGGIVLAYGMEQGNPGRARDCMPSLCWRSANW